MSSDGRHDSLPPIDCEPFMCSPRSVITRVFTALACLAALRTPATHADEAKFAVVPGQRQLFLDDHGIAAIDGLTRTLHRPVKRGAVIRSPHPHETIQIRTAPVWDPLAEHYKLWVLGIPENLWQSEDGLHWTPGPATNEKIHMAVYDPNETDPARRFKAPLLDRGFAVSPDGVQWTPLDAAKIQSSDEGNFSYDPAEGIFIHTVKRGGTHGRSVALATSRDFVHWEDFGLVFQADDRDQELGRQNIAARNADPTLYHERYDDPATYNVDVYNMGVFYYEGLYVGLPAMFHSTGPVPNYPNTVGFHLVQLACSRDLRNWQRLGDRQTFIGPSRLDSGAYDLTQILPPSAPVVRGDELWFYYTGLKWRGTFKYIGEYPNGHTEKLPGLDRDCGAVCLAVLRRDGFISLDAGENEGSLTTQPFEFTGSKLFVNVDALDGELRVELLDAAGKILAAANPVTGDQTRAVINWSSNVPATLEGQAVTLRFTLSNAGLYSYWLENASG